MKPVEEALRDAHQRQLVALLSAGATGAASAATIPTLAEVGYASTLVLGQLVGFRLAVVATAIRPGRAYYLTPEGHELARRYRRSPNA